MANLKVAYEVEESSTFKRLAPLRSPLAYARPPITLTPVSSKEAPIAIAFSSFPGLFVRFGEFIEEDFPVCGCDGCAPTFEREADRLQELIRSVVAGRFSEEIEIPPLGSAHLTWSFEGPNGSNTGRMMLSRDEARKLSSRSKRIEWQPWTIRT